ncbi:MAG: hypothetical protein JNL12_16000 [Planctomycetes bacterium]|nr:hypothetical protein [Planctomycetota bacterium]
MLRLAVVVASFACLLAGTAAAQDLLADLQPQVGGQPSSGGEPFFVLGPRAVFVATSQYGNELFATDGTPQGTELLLDGVVNNGSGLPQHLTVLGGIALFSVTVPGLGRELWRTDGTQAGTQPVMDLNPGRADSAINWPALYNGFVYFAATNGSNGVELWRSDGTALGTTMVVDLRPGSASSWPERLTVVGGDLYFAAESATAGRELHKLDANGTVSLVKDLTPGTTGTTFDTLAAFGSLLVFSANSGAGLEPHVSDGTALGTFQLADLNAGPTNSLPRDFATVGGVCVFAAETPALGRELYQTNGTAAGTTLLADLRPGSGSSSPEQLTTIGARVVFTATDDVVGRELFVTDGTGAGTGLLADVYLGLPSSNPGHYVLHQGQLWFGASSAFYGAELWRTDGLPGGTTIVEDLAVGNAGIYATGLTSFGTRLLFRGILDNAGVEPCVTDGTFPGTALLGDLNPPPADATPDQFTPFGTNVLFAALGNGLGRELYVSDGTQVGTQLFADLQPGSFGSNPTFLVPRGNDVFVRGDLFGGGSHLFLATAAGVTQLTSGASVQPRAPAVLGTSVVFAGESAATGREVWISDGTPAGTFLLRDIAPGATSSQPFLAENFTTAGNRTFFSANDGSSGFELWSTDGTPAGTTLVRDLRPGSGSSNPAQLTAVGNRVFFVANDGTSGAELWVSDGTFAGTTRIDVVPGPVGSNPSELVADGLAAWFTAYALGTEEVYRSDGTPAGTVAVTNGGAGQANPYSDLVPTQNGLFFVHYGLLNHGAELWHSTGTLASTHLVLDIGPGRADGIVPGTLAPALGGTQVVFGGNDREHGLQLWLSDGSAANTRRLTDWGSGRRGAVHVAALAEIATATWLAADDGAVGREPWRYDAAASPLAWVLPYGAACNGSNGKPRIGSLGLPTIGNAGFAVTLAQALPNSFAWSVVSYGSGGLAIGGGCFQLLADPLIPLVLLPTDGSGQSALPLAIPNTPSLAGSDLFFQWAVLDPLGAFLDGYSVSNALQTRLGF